MIRFSPAVGLLLASPLVIAALRGSRDVDEALFAWFGAMLLAAVGLWVLRQALIITRRPEELGSEADHGQEPGERGPASPGSGAAGSPGRRRGDS